MHLVRLLSVGKLKTPWLKDGCDMFADRLSKQCRFEERILSAGSETEEHARMLDALKNIDGTVVILDERGKEFSSQDFAKYIGKERDIGTPVTFVLGGAYGFDDAIRARGTIVMRLSRMTLPHELCKLFFLEQLYRAHAILAGSGYHH